MKGFAGPGMALVLAAVVAGCCHPSITAVPLSPWNQCEPEGIPYYLPKPLLIVSKNFRYIEESTVGLTRSAPIPGGFDDQAKYADVNARTSFNVAGGVAAQPVVQPSGSASVDPVLHSSGGIPLAPDKTPTDGLTPDTFYAYQIVFVPDLSQKYGLRVKGGVGEIRAAMNLVNGWMFTGMGPYYMKDSSTAQNILAGGITSNLALGGVRDVLTAVTDLRKAAGPPNSPNAAPLDASDLKDLASRLASIKFEAGPRVPTTLMNYAEIYVYEQVISDATTGATEWRLVTQHCFNRDFLKVQGEGTTLQFNPKAAVVPVVPAVPAKPNQPNAAFLGSVPGEDATEQAIYVGATERALGLPPGAIRGAPNVAQAAPLGSVPAGTTGPVAIANAPVTINPPSDCCDKPGPLSRLFHKLCHTPKTQTNVVLGASDATAAGTGNQIPGGILSPAITPVPGVSLPAPGSLIKPGTTIIPANSGTAP